MKNNLRNIAIIAHVDHGKTTLIDTLLHQSGLFRDNQKVEVRMMDSNDLEKERGITILSKCTSIAWDGYRLNIVDTPGHADFGGEVERILSMVDGVLLLVDAAEGPMPQTKFVLTKALAEGLAPIVVINKADRPDGRPLEVLEEVFDLFVDLNANDEQLDFPVLYASAREGWAVTDLKDPRQNMEPLLQAIIKKVPIPQGDETAPAALLATTMEYDSYLGRVLTGRIFNGTLKVNMAVKALSPTNELREQGRISKILAFRGMERVPVEEAKAGDIVAIAGLEKTTVGDTIGDPALKEALPSKPVDPPTLAMTFSVNDSPLGGKVGKKLTSRMIGERLFKEMESNVSITVKETANKDAFEVAGRGELQLGILIETMRREGFELSISRPRVLYRQDENGARLEPMEEVQVDVDEEFVGPVVEKMGIRKGELQNMEPMHGKTRLHFICPSRGLIGYRNEFLTDTRGTGLMNRAFQGYGPYKGPIEGRRCGVLISNGDGPAVAYALWYLEERGKLFVEPGDDVYEGMIIGENSRDNDLEVNPLKTKKLSNVRASGKDEAIKLTPILRMTLEQALAYIQDDELVEVTPLDIRLRKTLLDPNERKRRSRSNPE